MAGVVPDERRDVVAADPASGVVDQDLDAAFDSIVFAETIFQAKGFKQGSLVASNRDRSEGFSLGVKKAFEIGSEIGFFESFANVWIKLVEADSDKKNEKVRKELKKLKDLAEKVSDQNSKDEESESDVWSDLNLMRSKYRMICKLLKLETVDTKAKEISW